MFGFWSMKPSIAKCTCGELFIMKRCDFEGFDLCPACYTQYREIAYHASRIWRSYRPSNGTDRFAFQSAFCNTCHYDGDVEEDKGCKILAETMFRKIDDPEYPEEWIQNEFGESKCTKYTSEEQWAKEHKPVPRIPKNQMRLI